MISNNYQSSLDFSIIVKGQLLEVKKTWQQMVYYIFEDTIEADMFFCHFKYSKISSFLLY